MNRVKKTVRTLALMVLICMMLVTTVFAAGDGSAWLNVVQDTENESTAAYVSANTAVANGLVELAYNSEVLSYDSIEINEEFVAMYAVNADTDGVVKISWVAADTTATKAGHWLIRVQFAGLDENVTLTGTVNTAEGNALTLAENLDTTGLKAAVETAKGLYKDNYTSRSYKAVETALANAQEVLDNPGATQSAVDAAEETVNNAMDSLETKRKVNTSALIRAVVKANALCADQYTEESFSAMEQALSKAKAVLADPRATQQDVDKAAKALNDAMDALEEKSQEPEATEAPEKPNKPGKPSIPGKPQLPGNISNLISKIIKSFFGWFNKG